MSAGTGSTPPVLVVNGVTYAPLRPPEERPVSAEGEARRPLLLTIPEAARVLGVGISTLQKLYLSGEVESVTFGRARRIVYASLKRW